MAYILPTKYNLLTAKQKAEVRNQYVIQQQRKCYFCKESLDEKPPLRITSKPIHWNLFPPGFLKNPIHLQHNHATGMTEGAVHSYCNAVMWQYHAK